MRNLIISTILSLFITNLFAQSEKPSYQVMADKFVNFYNSDKPDSLFAIFSIEMQKALPLDKTTDFLAGLRSQAGQIMNKQIIKYQSTG